MQHPYDPTIFLLNIYPTEMKAYVYRNVHSISILKFPNRKQLNVFQWANGLHTVDGAIQLNTN